MSYTFRQNMVSNSKYTIKCPYPMSPSYITIHNTSNSASADAEVRYMISNNNQTSYHVCVDEKEVIQAIPFDRNAWHAGDGGNGNGNRKSIGIEIARSTGDANLFAQAEQNCAEYVAKLLKERGWGIDRVKRHKDWSGKNCPHKTMEKGWQRFLNMIQAELNKLNGKTSTSSNASNSNYKIGDYNKKVKTTDSLNIRSARNASGSLKGTLPKGTEVEVGYILYQDNSSTPKGSMWGSVYTSYGNGFINMDYTTPVTTSSSNNQTVAPKPVEPTVIAGEWRIYVLVDTNLWADTNWKTVSGQVKKGEMLYVTKMTKDGAFFIYNGKYIANSDKLNYVVNLWTKPIGKIQMKQGCNAWSYASYNLVSSQVKAWEIFEYIDYKNGMYHIPFIGWVSESFVNKKLKLEEVPVTNRR